MNTDGNGFHTCKECHKTESLSNHNTTDHKEGEQLEDRRSVGASSCNCGDGTDQRGPVLDVYDDWWMERVWLALNLREAITLCISNLYNILCTVNTQHTSRQDIIITIRLHLAIYNLTVIIASCLMYVVYWRYVIHYTKTKIFYTV